MKDHIFTFINIPLIKMDFTFAIIKRTLIVNYKAIKLIYPISEEKKATEEQRSARALFPDLFTLIK